MRARRLMALMLSIAMIVSSGSFSSIAYAATPDGGTDVIVTGDDGAAEDTVVADSEVESAEEATSTENESEIEDVTEISSSDESESDLSEDGSITEDESLSSEGDEAESDALENTVIDEVDPSVDMIGAYDTASPCFGLTEEGVLTVNTELEGFNGLPRTAVLPAGTKVIPKGIFDSSAPAAYKNNAVLYVRFLEGCVLESIESEAFYESTVIDIESVPATVTTINSKTFANSALGSISFKGEVTSVGEEAFQNTEIQSISLIKATEVGKSAFSGCSKLTTVDMPALTTINDYAFQNCGKLNVIAFSNTLSLIGRCAFQGSAITTLNFNGNTAEELVIREKAFEKNTALTSVVLSNNITKIPKYAFSECTKLNSVVFGTDSTANKIAEIDSYAFNGCTGLTAVNFYNVCKFDSCAFSGCAGIYKIIINYKETETEGFEIAEDAFPSRVGKTTIYGYDGKVKEYSVKRGYVFETLYPAYTISTRLISEQVDVKLNKVSAHPGEEIIITATPAAGYAIKTISLQLGSIDDIKLVEWTDKVQKYSFIMPKRNETIDVTTVKADKLITGTLSYTLKPTDSGYVIKNNTFDSSGQETQLVIKSGEEETYKYLWNYSSMNTKVATISKDGVIRAVDKGTATITATLKSNSKKSVSFVITVKDRAVIDHISLELPAVPGITGERVHKIDGEYKRATKTIDGETVPIIEFEKSSLDTNIEFEAGIKAYTPGDDRNLIVGSNWKSVDSSIASVASAKSGSNSNKITVKKGAVGETMITITVLNADETKATDANTKRFIVRVVDGTPRLPKNTITVNSRSTEGTKLGIVPVYGYSIAGQKLYLVRKNTAGGLTDYTESAELTIEYKNNDYYLVNRDEHNVFTGSYKGNTQLFIQGYFEETRESFLIPLTEVKVVNTELNPVIKTTGKINLFYKANADTELSGKIKVTQSLKDIEVTDVKLVSEAHFKKPDLTDEDKFAHNFEITKIDNTNFEITRSDNEMVQEKNKDVTGGYIYIYYAGYSTPYKKAINISTTVTAPSYILNMTSATAHEYKSNQVYEIQLLDKKTKKSISLANLDDDIEYGSYVGLGYDSSTTDGLFKPLDIDYAKSNDKIKLEVDGAPSKGKAVFYVQMDDWSKPLKYTFNLKTTKTLAKATFSNKGTATLNSSYASQTVELTTSLNQADAFMSGFDEANITKSASRSIAADIDKINLDFHEDSVDISISDPSVKKGTYTFKVAPLIKYEAGDDPIPLGKMTLKVVVTDSKPSIKLKNSTFTFNAKYPGVEEIAVPYTLGNLPTGFAGNVDDDSISITAVTKDAPLFVNIAEIDIKNGYTTVKLKDNTTVKTNAGKTFKYKIDNLIVRAGSDYSIVPGFVMTVSLKDTTPAMTIKASGSINPIDVTTRVKYTSTIKNIQTGIDVDTVKIWEKTDRGTYYGGQNEDDRYSEHFEIDTAKSDAKNIYVKVKDDKTVDHNKKYNITLVYKLEGVDDMRPMTYNFSITPKQTVPTIKTDKTAATIFAGQIDPSVDIKLTQVEPKKKETKINAEFETPEWDKSTSDTIKKAFKITFDPATDTMNVELVNASALVLNKKYDLTFNTKYTGQTKDTVANKFKVSVTVNK